MQINSVVSILLLSTLAGCSTLAGKVVDSTYIQKGVEQESGGTYSILTTDSEHNHGLKKGLDQRIYISHLDGEHLYQFGVLPISIEQAFLTAGPHTIEVQYRYRGLYANGCLELLSDPGKNYIVKKATEQYSVSFWLEDIESGEVVGNLCGFQRSQ